MLSIVPRLFASVSYRSASRSMFTTEPLTHNAVRGEHIVAVRVRTDKEFKLATG